MEDFIAENELEIFNILGISLPENAEKHKNIDNSSFLMDSIQIQYHRYNTVPWVECSTLGKICKMVIRNQKTLVG